ncbi:MAG TPA: FG-GAP repeat protein, partial [Pontimonas sp.]|nr:FG-GAP repeat protein [Pontimonas sp.]
LDGFSNNAQFGSSVALSANGRTVAIGAPTDRNTANELSSGQVSVYSYSTSWTQVGLRGQIEGESGDQLGHLNAVDISDDGTVVAVGARLRDNGGLADVGALEVYALTGGAWVQRGATEFGGLSAGDQFGYSVSLNGDGTIAAAGAPLANPQSRSAAGSTRVLEWNSTSWIQRGDDIPGGDMNEQFGFSISLDSSGDRIVASSPFNGNVADNAGRARVFDYAAGAWTQVGLDVEGEAANDNLGIDVAMSGDGATFAVGAHRDDGAGTDAGTVRVYTFRVESVTTEAAQATNPGTPGIYLHVAGPVGRQAEGSPVYYGSDRVAITSTYLLSITDASTQSTSRTLAEGVVDARGNLEARALLPALDPGTYDVVFQGKHRGGAGLRLTARITVGDAGSITVLGENVPQLW